MVLLVVGSCGDGGDGDGDGGGLVGREEKRKKIKGSNNKTNRNLTKAPTCFLSTKIRVGGPSPIDKDHGFAIGRQCKRGAGETNELGFFGCLAALESGRFRSRGTFFLLDLTSTILIPTRVCTLISSQLFLYILCHSLQGLL